jgi:hypothetical protein
MKDIKEEAQNMFPRLFKERGEHPEAPAEEIFPILKEMRELEDIRSRSINCFEEFNLDNDQEFKWVTSFGRIYLQIKNEEPGSKRIWEHYCKYLNCSVTPEQFDEFMKKGINYE